MPTPPRRVGVAVCVIAAALGTLTMTHAHASEPAVPHEAQSAEPAIVKPAPLRPGDTIMFVAPAGDLDADRIQRARQALEGMGFKVIVPPDLFRKRGYLAGDDATRAAEVMAAFTNPGVDAVFPGTGGYGVTRMLDLLDYGVIAQHPKVLIGFSDITALHLAIHAKTGLVSFHSPNPQWGLGSNDGLHPLAERYFWCALRGPADDGASGDDAVGWTYTWSDEEAAPLKVMVPGKARGRLIGGNLSLLAATVGTPYEMPAQGRILFLEDVREAPYRVDRMLMQLKSAGKLDGLAGVVIGQFTRVDPDDERSWSLMNVFEDFFADLGVPVVYDFPVGHVRANATMPIGALAEIDATGDTPVVRIVEEPTAPR